MQKLHGETLERFLKGEHVQRNRQGLWNGIWTDMFMETTFMYYGGAETLLSMWEGADFFCTSHMG